jgi:hypothetical protein
VETLCTSVRIVPLHSNVLRSESIKLDTNFKRSGCTEGILSSPQSSRSRLEVVSELDRS